MASSSLNQAPLKKIFVNREAELQLFLTAATNIPADRADLITFYGMGGQGKTRLLHQMLQNARDRANPSPSNLRCAKISLAGRASETGETFLIRVRNAFAEAGIATPAFDFSLALIWQYWRPGQSLPELAKGSEWIGRRQTGTEVGLDALSDSVSGWLTNNTAHVTINEMIGTIPAVGPIVKILGNWIVEKSKRAYLEHSYCYVVKLFDGATLRPENEIVDSVLYWVLAQDLNLYVDSANETYSRLILFLDEYEATMDKGGSGTRWRENAIERQLKNLLIETKGLLVVAFSREKLRWTGSWAGKLKGRQHLLGGLKYSDARIFLQAVPIVPDSLVEAMIDGARESASEDALIYPLMLDLQLEHWRVLSGRLATISPADFLLESKVFEDRCAELVARLLGSYGSELQTLIEVFSFCFSFDEAGFQTLCHRFALPGLANEFLKISALSIFSAQEDGSVRMHQIIAGAVQQFVSDNRRIEIISSLADHYAQNCQIQPNHRLRQKQIRSLAECIKYKSLLSLSDAVDFLLRSSLLLHKHRQVADSVQIWKDLYLLCEHDLGLSHRTTRGAGFAYAQFLLAFGDLAQSEEVIKELVEAGGRPSTNVVAHLIRFSPTLQIAQSWFDEFRNRIERGDSVAQEVRNIAFGSYLEKHKDFSLALESIKLREKVGATLNSFPFNILMEIGKSYERTLQVLEMMKRSNIEPTEHTYSIAHTYCSTPAQRADINRILSAYDIKLNVVVYNGMIDRAPDFFAATNIFRRMKANGFEPNTITYTTLIKKSTTSEEAASVFQDMCVANLTPDEVSFFFLIRKQERLEDCIARLYEMPRYGIRPSSEILSHVAGTVKSEGELGNLVGSLEKLGIAVSQSVLSRAIGAVL